MVRKIAVSLEEETVREIDRWVAEGRFPSRSRALQSAAELLRGRERKERLARELAKIDPEEERALADEALGAAPWPTY